MTGLLCNSIVHIDLAPLDSICKEADHSAATWLTLTHPVETPDAMWACGTVFGGESGDA